MAFRADTSKASESLGGLKDEGLYEVIIEEVKFGQTPSGKEKISVRYVIRNDVQQKYQNGYIFDDVWKRGNPDESDMTIGGYNFGQLMAIYEAAQLPNGKDYDTLDALFKDLCGKAIKVHLKHNPDKNGKIWENVDKRYVTNVPEVKHKPKEKPGATGYAAPPAAQFATSAAAVAASSIPTPAAGDDNYPF